MQCVSGAASTERSSRSPTRTRALSGRCCEKTWNSSPQLKAGMRIARRSKKCATLAKSDRQDPVCEEPDFYNGPLRPTTCRGSPRGIPIWAHRHPVTPDRCSQPGKTVRSDRRKPCKGRDVHRCRTRRSLSWFEDKPLPGNGIMPCSRHNSATGTPPSACRRIAMI